MKSERQESRSLSTVEIIGIVLGFLGLAATIILAKNPLLSVWVAVFAVIVLVLLFVIRVFKKHSQSIKEKLYGIQESLDDSAFLNYWTEKIYIPMDITLDPEGNEKRVPLFNHLVSLIHNKQLEWKYICLMGDTGSGKTDALVHFLIQYVEKYSSRSSMPSQIRLYTMNMGYSNLLERILEDLPKRIDRKNCILLLDALDECKEAQASLENTPQNNPRVFMERLAADIKDFAMVVVSCRKQFFMREEFNPDPTGIEIGNPRNTDPFLHWQRLYLAPFNDEQVEKYLTKYFGKYNNDSITKEARRIVFSCKDLFLRPMLLSHINIVMNVYGNRQESLTMKDVYDAIVFYWIQREARNDEDNITSILLTSLYVASFMYRNNLSYLDEKHYELLCNEYEIDDADHLLRVKLLLNNDKDGYRFSHKSFFEYLLAYWFFIDSDRIGKVNGLDFTLQIYCELVESFKLGKKESEIEQRLKVHNVPVENVVKGLSKLAYELNKLHLFSSAEKVYKETLDLYRKLSDLSPEIFLPDMAYVLNNMAGLHKNTHDYDRSETEYKEALSIRRKLAELFPEVCLSDLADTLNDIAILHEDTHCYREAEMEYQEALIIRQQLAENDPNTFLPQVAQTLNNLAFLHRRTKRYNEAEAEYQEALSINRKQSQDTPDICLPSIAAILNNLAVLHEINNFNYKAEAEYAEALSIRRELAKDSPEIFLPDVAGTLNNLAVLHQKAHQYVKAEVEFQEALKIRRQLASENPEAFLRYLADTLNDIALLHWKTHYYEKAEKEYQEALSIRRKLAEKNPDIYLPDVASTLRNIAILHYEQEQLEKALEEARESANIFDQMANINLELYEGDVKQSLQMMVIIAKKMAKSSKR